jgi:hypothetical protein
MFYIITTILISLTLNVYLAYMLDNIKKDLLNEKIKNKAMREYLDNKK